MNVHFPAQRRWASRLAHLAIVIVVLALTAATFVLSYTGVHSIALQAGVSARLARIYPGIFDAALVIACVAALMLREGRWWARAYAWLSIVLVIAVVGAADAVHAMNVALPHRKTAGVVAAAPWVLVLLGFSLWLTILRQSRTQHADQPPQPTALEPTALEPGARRPAALKPPVLPLAAAEPSVTLSAAREPTAPQPTAPQSIAPQSTPTAPQPKAPQFMAPHIPEDTSGAEETPASGEAATPEETATPEEGVTPEETVAREEGATLEEAVAPEEGATPERATAIKETAARGETAAEEAAATGVAAGHEPASSAETPVEQPADEAQGEASPDEGRPLSRQAIGGSETAGEPDALPRDYWDIGSAGEPGAQPADAPPAVHRHRVPAVPGEDEDEDEEPPPPFATMPRLRRVRSTPTPPEDDEEEQ